MQQTPPLKDIAAAIKVSGISKIDLSMEEVKLIVSTLVYDGLLEEVRGAASRFNRNVGGNGCTKYERKDGRNTRVRSVRWGRIQSAGSVSWRRGGQGGALLPLERLPSPTRSLFELPMIVREGWGRDAEGREGRPSVSS